MSDETSKGYSFIDTNVLFDIVYPQRTRHTNAIAFYKGFRNLELCIENIVNKEANKVTIEYASNFGTDLIRFLVSEERHSPAWDALNRDRRVKRIQDFVSWIKGHYAPDSPSFPFYMAIITGIQVILPDYSLLELKEYVIELPNSLLDWLRTNIRSRFSIHVPIYDPEDESIRKFQQDLKGLMQDGYFEKRQSADVMIFINLFLLLLVGSASVKYINELYYYTYDHPALTSFEKFKGKGPLMKEGKYNEWLKKGLTAINMKEPY